MTPVTLFSSTEGMYESLRELLYARPEYKHFDNGKFRVIELHPRLFPGLNGEAVFILMDYWGVDVWGEQERWLVVAHDGVHPDGYSSLEEAMQVLVCDHGIKIHDPMKLGRIHAYAVRRGSTVKWSERESSHMHAHLAYIEHPEYPRLVRLTLLWQSWMQRRMYGPALDMLSGQCESLYYKIFGTFCFYGRRTTHELLLVWC